MNDTDDAGAHPWYDSVWLARYIEAKSIVARVAPSRLDDFVAAFATLRVAADFAPIVIRGFLSDALLVSIRQTIHEIPADSLEMHEMKKFGRFVVHRWPEFTALQVELVGRVSELAGEPLEPSYNFLGLYTRMGVCQPHLDAPSAKWTLDICIDQSDPWPISFSRVVPWPDTRDELRAITPERIRADSGLEFRDELLMPGDAVLFSGTNQWHYRDAMPPGSGKRFCDLLFLHFVPLGAADLTQPKTWATMFGIPELGDMADLDHVY